MYEVTFNELCKIKREKLGLNIDEAERRIGYTNLARFEKAQSKVGAASKAKIIKFYGITKKEIDNCAQATISNVWRKKGKISVETIIEQVIKVEDKTQQMNAKGRLAKLLIEESLLAIEEIKTKLDEIKILDELLKQV